MSRLDFAKTCELHVHPAGCLTAEDILALGEDFYGEVDWRIFTDAYERAYGTRPDPIALFRNALSDPSAGLDKFREHYIYAQKDGGDFGRFQAKFNLIIGLLRHPPKRRELLKDALQRTIDRHEKEGITFVEYRCGCSDETRGAFLHFHRVYAQLLARASQRDTTARYIISLRRWAAMQDYEWVQALLDENPELIPTIVGIDFAHIEEGHPPKRNRALFKRIRNDNLQRPHRALEITYHVGESYFDKSLESAIRWCHEAAEMGARRLGHAIALGLDPEIAIARRADAHVKERVGERLAQIAYDLNHAPALSAYGLQVNAPALRAERQSLKQRASDDIVARPYTPQRLAEIRNRQQFVLNRLARLGTVIETCPTSNLRIGGVPDPAHHPIHTFLKSDVNLAIGADDPGIFDSPLASEIDWVLAHTNWTPEALANRLGDPRRFQLGRLRRPSTRGKACTDP